MKKLILSLMSAMFGCTAFAANCVTAAQIGTDYATRTITFKLTWTDCNAVNNHLNKVWCFIDFRAAGSTSWTRAAIGGTPSVVNGTYAAGNADGFYVTGANGQSATITVRLGNAPDQFDWCAFASDCPPVALLMTGGGNTYMLYGTKPFLANGEPVNVDSYTGSITTFTDVTGCPGIIASVVTNAVTGAHSNVNDIGNVYTLNGSINIGATERGFVYSSGNASPTTGTGVKITTANGNGAFNYSWQNTTYSTTFYVRAYAIVNGTTAYGSVQSFKTWGAWGNYTYIYGPGVYNGYTYCDLSCNYPHSCIHTGLGTTKPSNTATSQWSCVYNTGGWFVPTNTCVNLSNYSYRCRRRLR